MAGIDDNIALLGDWPSPCPSPGTWFSTFFDGNSGLRQNLAHLEENKNGGYSSNTRDDMISEDIRKTIRTPRDISNGQATYSEEKNLQGGLVERMAARAGYSVPRLNIERIRSPQIITNSNVRSPYLTIPPGLSPAALLESPIFLHNSLVQLSPRAVTHDRSRYNLGDNITTSSFSIKPADEPGSFFVDSINKTSTNSLHEESIAGSEVSSQSDNSLRSQDSELAKAVAKDHSLLDVVSDRVERSSILNRQGQHTEDGLKESGDLTNFNVAPSEDGYNWRKYGQKEVKGCEYPRNYYICAHPDCLVKKKVERSYEGHITEIIYKGTHNHPPPPPSCRVAIGSSNTLEKEKIGDDNDSVSINIQMRDSFRTLERRNENLKVTPISLSHEFRNSRSLLLPQNGNANGDKDEMGTHGNISLACDDEGEESESKRRKVQVKLNASELMGATRAIQKPRVVVQTTSEVDILDDGYRWRKYGQKVVRGNPNPRSYYKCTTPGCNVRKHVERASCDVKYVITTYEGKHNHVVPPGRSTSHLNSRDTPEINEIATATTYSEVNTLEAPQIRNNVPRFESFNPFSSFGMSQRSQVGASHALSFRLNTSRLGNMPRDIGFMVPRSDPTNDIMPTNSWLYQQYIERLARDHQL